MAVEEARELTDWVKEVKLALYLVCEINLGVKQTAAGVSLLNTTQPRSQTHRSFSFFVFFGVGCSLRRIVMLRFVCQMSSISMWQYAVIRASAVENFDPGGASKRNHSCDREHSNVPPADSCPLSFRPREGTFKPKYRAELNINTNTDISSLPASPAHKHSPLCQLFKMT